MGSRPPIGAAVSDPSRAEADSRAWLRVLRGARPERDEAIGRLHELLVRAARFEVSRRRGAFSHVRGEELDDIAVQAADDALVAVLAKLDDYRGASRFTTWAYKFALLEAGVRLRRRAWQEREVVLEPEAWPRMADAGQSPEGQAETRELVQALRRSIDVCLTDHQREVLVALALNGVPLDVLTERLNTTRAESCVPTWRNEALRSTRSSREIMNKHTHEDTLKRLLGPAGPELLCDECFEKLDEYVELELEGAPADDRIPGMRAHLEGCPACHEDYDSLRELVRGDEPNS